MRRGTYILSLVMVLFVVMLLVSGGTYAYWAWTSSTNTDIVFTTAGLEDSVIYNEGDSFFIGDFQPKDTFCESANTTLSFYKTSDAESINLSATIYMDVNYIGSNISSSSSVYWVLTSGDSSISCTDGLSSSSVVNSGTFNGVNSGDTIELSSDIEVTTTEQIFTVWIWIDSNGSNLSSLSGETIDTNIWTQIDMVDGESTGGDTGGDDSSVETFIVYSEDDNSLRFYKNADEVTEGSVYNGRTATNVLYTDIESMEQYDYSWSDFRGSAEIIVVEDEITAPISTSEWFSNFEFVSSIDVSKLDTSNVTDMSNMFSYTGYDIYEKFEIIGLENFNTSKVLDMSCMFLYTGSGATETFDIGDISHWDVAYVGDMSSMFESAGEAASTFIIDLSSWYPMNVTDMSNMFSYAGYGAETFEIVGLGYWETFSVTNMSGMFSAAGYKAKTFDIGDISTWETRTVKNMSNMFSYAGYNASYTLDLFGWNVTYVANWNDFNLGVEDKVRAPDFGLV